MDHLPPEEARPNLADLVRLNRDFGGHSVLREVFSKVVKTENPFTVLDVGAASGDTARVLQQMYPAASIASLDYNATNLERAPLPKVMANAFQLPFGEDSFDFVLSSLFLHHFSDDQVIALLRSFYGLARRALVVCDLERHIVPYWFLPATKLFLGWNDVTVHDGRMSVQAAFRPRELLSVAQKAGIDGAQVHAHRPAFRLSLTALKRDTAC